MGMEKKEERNKKKKGERRQSLSTFILQVWLCREASLHLL